MPNFRRHVNSCRASNQGHTPRPSIVPSPQQEQQQSNEAVNDKTVYFTDKDDEPSIEQNDSTVASQNCNTTTSSQPSSIASPGEKLVRDGENKTKFKSQHFCPYCCFLSRSNSSPPIDASTQVESIRRANRESRKIKRSNVSASLSNRKCVSYFKAIIAFLFSHVGLFLVVTGYCIGGALLFQHIERNTTMVHLEQSRFNHSRAWAELAKVFRDRIQDVIDQCISSTFQALLVYSKSVGGRRHDQLIEMLVRQTKHDNVTRMHKELTLIINHLKYEPDIFDVSKTTNYYLNKRIAASLGGDVNVTTLRRSVFANLETLIRRLSRETGNKISFLLHTTNQLYDTGLHPNFDRVMIADDDWMIKSIAFNESGRLSYNIKNSESNGSSNSTFNPRHCNCSLPYTSSCRTYCLTLIKLHYLELEHNEPWTMADSLLFTLSVITTIGYGNLVPKTPIGHISTIFYATFGIPLTLLCIANIGGFMADCFRFVYRNCCLKLYNHREQKKSALRMVRSGKSTVHAIARTRIDDDDEKSMTSSSSHTTPAQSDDQLAPDRVHVGSKQRTSLANLQLLVTKLANSQSILTKHSISNRSIVKTRVPTWLTLLVLTSYLVVGAIIFARWENWTILESFYFVFETLATIGSGDYVPEVNDKNWSEGLFKPIFCSIYLIIGLSVVAMCFDLMQEEVVERFRGFAIKIGLVEY